MMTLNKYVSSSLILALSVAMGSACAPQRRPTEVKGKTVVDNAAKGPAVSSTKNLPGGLTTNQADQNPLPPKSKDDNVIDGITGVKATTHTPVAGSSDVGGLEIELVDSNNKNIHLTIPNSAAKEKADVTLKTQDQVKTNAQAATYQCKNGTQVVSKTVLNCDDMEVTINLAGFIGRNNDVSANAKVLHLERTFQKNRNVLRLLPSKSEEVHGSATIETNTIWTDDSTGKSSADKAKLFTVIKIVGVDGKDENPNFTSRYTSNADIVTDVWVYGLPAGNYSDKIKISTETQDLVKISGVVGSAPFSLTVELNKDYVPVTPTVSVGPSVEDPAQGTLTALRTATTSGAANAHGAPAAAATTLSTGTQDQVVGP